MVPNMRFSFFSLLLMGSMFSAVAQQVIIPPRYSTLSTVFDELAVLQPGLVQVSLPDGKTGILELPSGKELIAPKYDGVFWHKGTGIMVNQPDADQPNSAMRCRSGNVVDFPNTRMLFSYLMEDNFERFLYFDTNGSMGVVDNDGKIRVKPGTYTIIEPFIEGRAIAQAGESWSVLDTNGAVLATLKNVQMLESYSGGFARFQRDGLYGFLDKNGKEAIAPRFTEAFPFLFGLATVTDEHGKAGCINPAGKMVVPAQYDYCFANDLGHITVGIGDFQGLLDMNGNPLIAPNLYTEINPATATICVVRSGDLYGAITTQGKEILPQRFTYLLFDPEARHFTGAAETGMGLYDETGKALVAARYQVVSEMQSDDNYENLPKGIVRVGTGDGNNLRWGYARTSGEELLAPQYDYLQELAGEVAVVGLKEKMGMVNLQGKVLIPFGQYGSIGYHTEGFYSVTNAQDRYGFVDKTGKVVVPLVYTGAYAFQDGLAAVMTEKGTWGIVNTTGKMVVEPVYEEVMPLEKNLFGVLQNGLWGIIRVD